MLILLVFLKDPMKSLPNRNKSEQWFSANKLTLNAKKRQNIFSTRTKKATFMSKVYTYEIVKLRVLAITVMLGFQESGQMIQCPIFIYFILHCNLFRQTVTWSPSVAQASLVKLLISYLVCEGLCRGVVSSPAESLMVFLSLSCRLLV